MTHENSFTGPLADPAADAGDLEHPPGVGLNRHLGRIGCKACEVACKEWTRCPRTGSTCSGHVIRQHRQCGVDSWRHVAFIEQDRPLGAHDAGLAGLPPPRRQRGGGRGGGRGPARGPRGGGDLGAAPVDLAFLELPGAAAGEAPPHRLPPADTSDVCKHCTHAGLPGRLPDRGAVPHRVRHGRRAGGHCNGCGDRVSGCPDGVIDRRHGDGRASKCTLRHDRLRGGLEPACAKACPTRSIELVRWTNCGKARPSDGTPTTRALPRPRLYGHDPDDGVGGAGRSSCC